MDFSIFDLFEYLKNEEYDKFEKSLDFIKDNNISIDDIDLNMKDDNNNYLITYLILSNKHKLVEKLLEIESIKIDIYDSDGRSILYIPIKYNYEKIFKTLLDYNNKTIGVSICDVRDYNGNIALHYSIKIKKLDFIEELLKNNSNTLFADNNGNNALHLSVFTRELKIVDLILKYSIREVIINSRNNIGETPIHFATNLQEIKLVKTLINNGANINYQDYEHEYNILHYAINLSTNDIVKLCIENNIDINRQDVYGNTALHYCILENNVEIFNTIINSKLQINVNLWNVEGKIPLHLLLKNSSNIKKEMLDYLIENSNLNIQDNDYETCLHLICEYNIWENYYNILSKKKLDILLKNKNSNRPIDFILKLKEDKQKKFIDIVTDSYLYLLENNKDKIWENDWENICKVGLEELNFSNEEISKIKQEDVKINVKKNKKDNCKDIIKSKVISLIESNPKLCSMKTFPVKRGKLCIVLDENNEESQNKNLQFCTFTGSTLDVLLGLIYLLKKHTNSCSTVPKDFRENKKLCDSYEDLGIIMSSRCELLNFEIVLSYNKIHFVDNFDNILDKCLLNDSKRFIIIPIGIEIDKGSHANYLIIDKELGEIERFEPHGANKPYGFNYNDNLLDKTIEKKFQEIFDEKLKKKIKYFRPVDFLPKISLQMLDIIEKKKKKIGDPGGFCALWSIYYTDMRLSYPNISRKKIIKYIINTVKEQNLSYKNLIRNYGFHIIKIRDEILSKTSIDINDWINDSITNQQFDNVIKDINDLIARII